MTQVWLDEEAADRTGLNDRMPTLVNDLDMSLTSPSGKVIQPWTLDLTRPLVAAERGHDVCENVERIDVPLSMLTRRAYGRCASSVEPGPTRCGWTQLDVHFVNP
jgi:hypothetical protein